MQFVLAFSCLLAVASAGYIHNAAPVAVSTGSHAVAYNAPLVSAPHPVPIAPVVHAYAAPVVHAYAAPVAVAAPVARSFGYSTSSVHPVGYGYAGPYAHGYAHAHGIAHTHAYAAPVAHAYAAHAYAAPVAHAYAAHAVGLASEARLVDPVAIAAGAPLPTGDTLEVAHAKAAHAAAHHDAKATHFLAKGHLIAKRSPGYLGATSYAAPLAYSGYSGYASPLAYSGYGYGLHGGYYL